MQHNKINTCWLDKLGLTEDENRQILAIYKTNRPYRQVNAAKRGGFDATILPAIAKGFLAGKKHSTK